MEFQLACLSHQTRFRFGENTVSKSWTGDPDILHVIRTSWIVMTSPNSCLVGKLGRRIAQRVTPDTTDNLSSDEDSDDEDYIFHDSDVDSIHSSDYDSSDYFSEEEDLDEELQSLIDDEPDTPETSEPQFLEDVLTNFRYICKGTIDWEDKNIDYLVSEVLQKPENCLKLLHEHLNVIRNLIKTYTGVNSLQYLRQQGHKDQ